MIIATRPAHQPLSSHCISGSGARGTSSPLNRQCYPPHFMRECIPPNLHNPQRAKGFLDRRSKRLSFPHFFLRRKKCGRRRPPPRQGKANSPPQRRKRAFFVSDWDSFAPRRELLLSAVTKVAKSTGRNCVSALPQRATVGCDFPHLLAGITFHHRCRSKGLRVRSPARRLTRPLAPATVGVFRSYRRPLQAFPLEGSAVLNDTPVACQTRGPTRRETGAPISRRR